MANRLSTGSGQRTRFSLVNSETLSWLSAGGANGGSVRVIAQQRYTMLVTWVSSWSKMLKADFAHFMPIATTDSGQLLRSAPRAYICFKPDRCMRMSCRSPFRDCREVSVRGIS